MAVTLEDWRALTEAIDDIEEPKTMVMDKLFKDRQSVESEHIDIDVIIGHKKLAPFVAPLEGGVIVEKLGQQQKSIKAPRIRPKKELNPDDFKTRAPGAGVYVKKGDYKKNRDKKIRRELKDLKDQITRRKEWMCCRALSGSITVAQDNVSFNINFGLPSEHKPVLSGNDLWSDNTTSDPVAKIRAWKKLINQKTGYSADIAFCGSKAAEDLLNNSKVQKLLDNRAVLVGELKIDNTEYIGTLAGVKIYQYDEQYVDDAGNTQDMIPSTAFVLCASKAPFKLFYGMVKDIKAGGVAMPYFSKMYEQEDPSALFLLAESRPVPVPARPEAVVYATVTS